MPSLLRKNVLVSACVCVCSFCFCRHQFHVPRRSHVHQRLLFFLSPSPCVCFCALTPADPDCAKCPPPFLPPLSIFNSRHCCSATPFSCPSYALCRYESMGRAFMLLCVVLAFSHLVSARWRSSVRGCVCVCVCVPSVSHAPVCLCGLASASWVLGLIFFVSVLHMH